MRRFTTIVKYTPTGLCILLTIAWLSSFFIIPDFTFPAGSGYGGIIIENATLNLFSRSAPRLSKAYFVKRGYFETHWSPQSQPTKFLGVFHWQHVGSDNWTPGHSRLLLPIPLIILMIVPFAIAPLTRFRLPLWSWFAWTTAIAAALVFYGNTSRLSN